MLPASKDDFPKGLYLDQNKWIDLARAHYGKPEGKPFQDALRAVRTGVESGKLVVPFSIVNAIEAMIPRDAGRRERLARFMVALSGNRTILPEESVCQWEIRNAVGRLVGRGSPTAVRPLVIQFGAAHALGLTIQVLGPATETEVAIQHIRSSEMTVSFLMMASDKRERIQQARAGEAGAVSVFEGDRARATTLSLEQRRRLEFEGLLFGTGPYQPALVLALEELGLTVQDFRGRVHSAEDAMRFLADIPSLDVLLTLRLARDQDLVRPIDRNDIRDLDWLSVAVPYCNVVVSENYWGHQVRATGLDRKYGTMLMTDVRKLPQQLQGMIGCIG
jgi:hypothetical protein